VARTRTSAARFSNQSSHPIVDADQVPIAISAVTLRTPVRSLRWA
jgi:hypothetical protein